MDKIIHIGIIGTGRIVERFIDESQYVNGIKLVAIYNRHMESIEWLAARKGLSQEKDDILFTTDKSDFYDKVDAVYIAAPHEYHVDYAMEALENGKHVLCEKPLAMATADAKKVYNLAKAKGLVCMEAIKTAYCPTFALLLDTIQQKVIGKVRDIEATFTKIGSGAGREMWGRYGGSFVELGSYVMLPVMKLYGLEKPDMHCFSLAGAPGHDSYTRMMLSYENRVASIKTGLGVKSEGQLIISGDRGYILVPSPWWLTRRFEVHHENPAQIEIYEDTFEGSGLRYEISAFVRAIAGDEDAVKISPQDSIWLAGMMESFLQQEKEKHGADGTAFAGKNQAQSGSREALDAADNVKASVGIWAHRGCSMAYPENTLLTFKKAAELPGLVGIELDTQLTKDGQIVVIHDESVDRTTSGSGFVRDFTLAELQDFAITGSGQHEAYALSTSDKEYLGSLAVDKPTANQGHLWIPTLEEVFQLMKPYCISQGTMINIELKNSIFPYEGMEEKVIDLVHRYELEDYIVYSSFNHESLGLVKKMLPKAQTGALASDYHDCLEGYTKYDLDAIHPWNCGMPVNAEDVEDLQAMAIYVRAYNGSEPLFGQCRRLPDMDLREYARLGATDIFTNAPERYLQ